MGGASSAVSPCVVYQTPAVLDPDWKPINSGSILIFKKKKMFLFLLLESSRNNDKGPLKKQIWLAVCNRKPAVRAENTLLDNLPGTSLPG